MELSIHTKENIDELERFVNDFLLDYAKDFVINTVNIVNCNRFSESVNYLLNKETLLKRIFSVKEILIGAISNLTYTKKNNRIVISVDTNVKVPNTNVPYITVAKLVNEGTIDLAPYPIIDDTFEFLGDHLEDIYLEYIRS